MVFQKVAEKRAIIQQLIGRDLEEEIFEAMIAHQKVLLIFHICHDVMAKMLL
jgi:hypothetical protein